MSVRPRARESRPPRNPPGPRRAIHCSGGAGGSAVSKTAKPTVSDCFLGITTIFVIRALNFTPSPRCTASGRKRSANNAGSCFSTLMSSTPSDSFARSRPTGLPVVAWINQPGEEATDSLNRSRNRRCSAATRASSDIRFKRTPNPTASELGSACVCHDRGDLHRTQVEVNPGVIHAARRRSDQPLATTTGRGPRFRVGPPTPGKILARLASTMGQSRRTGPWSTARSVRQNNEDPGTVVWRLSGPHSAIQSEELTPPWANSSTQRSHLSTAT
jgi:hypothetical protein